MDTSLKYILIALLVGLVVAFSLLFIASDRGQTDLVEQVEQPLGGPMPFSQATNTHVACGTSSTLVVATSSVRQYLEIVNDSASTVYLSYGVPAVGSNGIRLNAGGGALTMESPLVFTGSIYCIASSTAVVTVVRS